MVPDGLTPALALRVIRRHRNQFQHCYREALKDDETLVGEAQISITVKPDGHIDEAKSEGPNKKLDACFVLVVNRMRFPSPTSKKTVRLSVPVILIRPPAETDAEASEPEKKSP